MASGSLSDTLAHLAPKRVLKKTLFDKIGGASEFPPMAPANFPLIPFSKDLHPLAYRSAIALKQAASDAIDAEVLAKKWVQVLTWLDESDDRSGIDPAPNPVPWMVEVETRGWIAIVLTDSWISTWLQELNQPIGLPFSAEVTSQSLLPKDLSNGLSQRPLCLQLSLSLPMLLQFAHASCCHWLRQQLRQREPSIPGSVLDPSLLDDEQATGWGWSSQSPAACHSLLQAIARALDTMADQQGDRLTYWRQGYRLAEAVYTFQAALPLATVQTFPSEIQVSIWSIVKAAQQSLALVILSALKQTPVRSL